MRQRYWLSLVAILVLALLVSVFIIFDTAVSLDHARSQNARLAKKCELLARLAEPSVLVGYTESDVAHLLGPEIIVKAEGDGLMVEDLHFRMAAGKVTGIDADESCR